MFKTLSPVYKGIVFALIGYSGFAISDASAKFLTASMNTPLIVATIAFFAAVFLLLLSPFLGGMRKPKPEFVKLHALRALMNFTISIAIVMAFRELTLAATYTIIFSTPFLTALLAIPIYKEKVPLKNWAVIAIGFVGILVAMRPGSAGLDPSMFLPFIVAMASAVMWVVSRSMQGESAFAMGFYPVFGTVLLCLPFIGSDFSLPALSQLPFLMICGAGISAGVLGLSMAYRTGPSSAVAPFHYVQMVWGVFFGYVIFGDIPEIHTLIGAGIIIASGLYLVLSERAAGRNLPV